MRILYCSGTRSPVWAVIQCILSWSSAKRKGLGGMTFCFVEVLVAGQSDKTMGRPD